MNPSPTAPLCDTLMSSVPVPVGFPHHACVKSPSVARACPRSDVYVSPRLPETVTVHGFAPQNTWTITVSPGFTLDAEVCVTFAELGLKAPHDCTNAGVCP